MLDLDTVKMHLRVNHSLEDELIEMYLEWAKSIITNAVFDGYDTSLDKELLEKDTTFNMACIMLTTYYYENRITVSEVNQHDNPYSVLHAIQVLRGMRHHFIKGDSNENK